MTRWVAPALLVLPVLLAGCQDLRTVDVSLINDGGAPVDIVVTVSGAGVRRERAFHLEAGEAWSERWLLPDGAYALRFDDSEHPVRDDVLDACRIQGLTVRHDGTRYTVVQAERGDARLC